MAGESLTNHEDLLNKLPVEDRLGFARLDDDGGHISVKPEGGVPLRVTTASIDPQLVELYRLEDDGNPITLS